MTITEMSRIALGLFLAGQLTVWAQTEAPAAVESPAETVAAEVAPGVVKTEAIVPSAESVLPTETLVAVPTPLSGEVPPTEIKAAELVPPVVLEDDRAVTLIVRKFESYPEEIRLTFALFFIFIIPLLFFAVLQKTGRIGNLLVPFGLYLALVGVYLAWVEPWKGYDTRDLKSLMQDKPAVTEISRRALRPLLLSWHILVLPSALLAALLLNRILGLVGFAKKPPNRLKKGYHSLEMPHLIAELLAEEKTVRVFREEGPPGQFVPYEVDFPYIKFHDVVYDLRDMLRIQLPGKVYELKSGSVIEFGKNER
jgi:hypothetical protein